MNENALVWLEILTRMAQLLASAGVVVVSVSVFRWTRKRDAADFFRSNWADQQSTNLMHLGNPAARAVHEKMVYGQDLEENERELLFFVLFTKINRVLQFFNAFEADLISYNEYVQQTVGTIRLLGNQEYWVRYLVTERGYSDRFRDELLLRIGEGGVSRHWEDFSVAELDRKLTSIKSKHRLE